MTGGVAHIVRDLGHGTSMDAEWLALIHALQVARDQSLNAFVLLGDSIAVIDQANGKVRSRGAHLATFRALVATGAPPLVRYIKRSQNLAGIALWRMHNR